MRSGQPIIRFKETNVKYSFIVQDLEGVIIFNAEKPSIALLEEEIGRWERQEENYKHV